MTQISIIMPLYNADRYLEESLESIKNQTFAEYELVCVCDGCTDTTLDILEKFRKTDARLRILQNDERMGAAPSRNRALKEVQSEYIMFLDGDDLFEPDMLELAHAAAEQYGADIAEYNMEIFEGEAIHRISPVLKTADDRRRMCLQTFSLREYSPLICMRLGTSPCKKIYRRKFIMDNRIEFQNLPSSNDVYFSDLVLMLAEKIVFVETDRILLHARQHSAPSRISVNRNPFSAFYAAERLQNELLARGRWEENAPYFYIKALAHINYELSICKKEETRNEFLNFLSTQGIPLLRERGGEAFVMLNPYIRGKFEWNPAESIHRDAFRLDNTFCLHLHYFKDKVLRLLKELAKEGKQIGVWGIGGNGRAFLEFIAENNCTVQALIDSDDAKIGSRYNGLTVESMEKTCSCLQVIIVTSSRYFVEISDRIALSYGDMEVIDLQSCLQDMVFENIN